MSRFSAQILELAIAHFPKALLRDGEAESLRAVAGAVAPMTALYFECRLKGRDMPVDVSQHFSASAGGPAALLALARRHADSADSWQRLAAFAAEWRAGGPLVEFGLEHDRGVAVPALFGGVATGLAEDRAAVAAFLAALVPESGVAWARMSAAIDAAGRHGLVAGRLIGAMLSRDGQLRCVFRGLRPQPAMAFLREIGWPGDVDALGALLAQPPFASEAARLVLGFAPDPVAGCGIEMIYRKGDTGEGLDGRDALLAWLVDQGLAEPERVAALAEWNGPITPMSAGTDWPDALIAEDLRAGFDPLVYFTKSLSHVKLNIADGRIVEAKAYLALMPTQRGSSGAAHV